MQSPLALAMVELELWVRSTPLDTTFEQVASEKDASENQTGGDDRIAISASLKARP